MLFAKFRKWFKETSRLLARLLVAQGRVWTNPRKSFSKKGGYKTAHHRFYRGVRRVAGSLSSGYRRPFLFEIEILSSVGDFFSAGDRRVKASGQVVKTATIITLA